MKRAVTSPQYITCQVCENRIMAPLAKKGICPACHIADQGPVCCIAAASGEMVATHAMLVFDMTDDMAFPP